MRIPARYWGVTYREISDGVHKDIVQKYLRNLEDMTTRGVGLLLYGPNGRGKTGIAVVIAKELRRRGKTVLFLEAADLKRAVIDKIQFDATTSIFERARTVDALVLDDLGKGVQDGTGFGARLIDELIRYRNARKLLLFLTMNARPVRRNDDEASQLEEELKASTMHTLKECVVPVEVLGLDFRDPVKNELRELLVGD
jgi:DNA replication protein DnaC